MSEYKPLLAFLFLTILLNVILLSLFTGFGLSPTIDEGDIPDFLTPYFDVKDLLDAISIPFVGGIIDILTLGLFSDYVEDLVIIYLYIPLSLASIILVPMVVGAIYSMIKLLPTT